MEKDYISTEKHFQQISFEVTYIQNYFTTTILHLLSEAATILMLTR